MRDDNPQPHSGALIVCFTQTGKSWRQSFCALLLALTVSGCATPPPQPRVADWPEPPVLNRPELPVLAITKDMDPGTVLQLHRETIKRLQAWGLELEAALNAYRKKDPK